MEGAGRAPATRGTKRSDGSWCRAALLLLGALAAPLVWLGVLLFAAAVLLWIAAAQGSRRGELALALGLVMGLALLARIAHFDTYPRSSLDEVHNAWAGFNLIHEGHPRTWSWLPIYEKSPVNWFSYSYPIVPNAFDHPPLLPLLVGLEATLLGAEDMFDCVLSRTRPLMVVLGTLSVGLLFLVAREVTSFGTAILAAVSMAVCPLVVFNSRLVKKTGWFSSSSCSLSIRTSLRVSDRGSRGSSRVLRRFPRSWAPPLDSRCPRSRSRRVRDSCDIRRKFSD